MGHAAFHNAARFSPLPSLPCFFLSNLKMSHFPLLKHDVWVSVGVGWEERKPTALKTTSSAVVPRKENEYAFFTMVWFTSYEALQLANSWFGKTHSGSVGHRWYWATDKCYWWFGAQLQGRARFVLPCNCWVGCSELEPFYVCLQGLHGSWNAHLFVCSVLRWKSQTLPKGWGCWAEYTFPPRGGLRVAYLPKVYLYISFATLCRCRSNRVGFWEPN